MGPNGITCIQGSRVVEMDGRGINVRNGSQNLRMDSNGITILDKPSQTSNYSSRGNSSRGHQEPTGTNRTRYFPSETSVFETSGDDDYDEENIYEANLDAVPEDIYQMSNDLETYDIEGNENNNYRFGFHDSEEDEEEDLCGDGDEQDDMHPFNREAELFPNINLNINFSYRFSNSYPQYYNAEDNEEENDEQIDVSLESDQESEPHTENLDPIIYPSFKYKKNNKGTPETCSVCRADFTQTDDCRRLPCLHFFHNECIDRWICVHHNCPLCRTKC